MPNRIIRDSALSSKKLASVSAEAERLFWRLLMIADDFGRFQGEPSLILARCFPLQVKDYSVRQVGRWYAELVKCGAIVAYSTNGDIFGQFLVWGQRLRSAKSKYPGPDDGQLTVMCPSSDGQPRTETETETETRSETETETVPPPGGPLRGFDEFWKSYPKKKSKGDAEKAWKALRPATELQSRILAAVALHRNSNDWLKDGGQWIPYPATWLRAKRWEDTIDNDRPRFDVEEILGPRPKR